MIVDITECDANTCSGNGMCTEVVGGGTKCICEAGYTSENCSQSEYQTLNIILCRTELHSLKKRFLQVNNKRSVYLKFY